ITRAVQINLHPQGAARIFGNILQRGIRDIAERKWNARLRSGARKLQVALMREHSIKTGRPDRKRARHALTEEFNRLVTVGHIDKRARQKADLFEYFPV